MYKFHVAARLPGAAKASSQFAQAIAVNEIHPLEIDQEFLVAVASEDVNQVAQLSTAVSQRESPHNIDHNDAIALSRCDLKTHICLAGWLFFPESYAWLRFPSRLRVHILSSHFLPRKREGEQNAQRSDNAVISRNLGPHLTLP
jgi:hypothetical protein